MGQTCGILPVGIDSTVLSTVGLRWNLGACALSAVVFALKGLPSAQRTSCHHLTV